MFYSTVTFNLKMVFRKDGFKEFLERFMNKPRIVGKACLNMFFHFTFRLQIIISKYSIEKSGRISDQVITLLCSSAVNTTLIAWVHVSRVERWLAEYPLNCFAYPEGYRLRSTILKIYQNYDETRSIN